MKIRLCAGVACAVMILMVVQGCGQQEVEEQVQVVRPVKTIVASGSEAFNRAYPGKVKGAESVNISFRVSGPLLELPAKAGSFCTLIKISENTRRTPKLNIPSRQRKLII